MFFADNPDFDLETKRVKEDFEAADTSRISDEDTLLSELKNINRLYKLTPNYEHVAQLRREQLTSSSDIVRNYTENAFINKFKDTLGEAVVKTTYAKAAHID